MMKKRDSKLFDNAVKKFFEPITHKFGLSLIKIRDGIYEVPSPYFIMRIRLDTGHERGLNVLLRPASLQNYDECKTGEYGIVCFMQFNDHDMKPLFASVNTDEDFLELTKAFAQASERFGIPYLLGQKNDFEAVKKKMKEKNASTLEKIRQLQQKMPSFVREEWPLNSTRQP